MTTLSYSSLPLGQRREKLLRFERHPFFHQIPTSRRRSRCDSCSLFLCNIVVVIVRIIILKLVLLFLHCRGCSSCCAFACWHDGERIVITRPFLCRRASETPELTTPPIEFGNMWTFEFGSTYNSSRILRISWETIFDIFQKLLLLCHRWRASSSFFSSSNFVPFHLLHLLPLLPPPSQYRPLLPLPRYLRSSSLLGVRVFLLL